MYVYAYAFGERQKASWVAGEEEVREREREREEGREYYKEVAHKIIEAW